MVLAGPAAFGEAENSAWQRRSYPAHLACIGRQLSAV